MRQSVLAMMLLGAVALSGCDTKALTQATNAATGPKVTVTGKIFAPADQVAVIASGALQWGVLARADEKGVKDAKVVFSQRGKVPLPAATVTTGTTGEFTAKVPAGATYSVMATFTAKDEQMVTLSGLAVVGDGDTSLELDIAHNLVASKLEKTGAEPTADKLKAAVDQMQDDLSAVSKAPMPMNQDEAAAEFDKLAGEELKKLVSEMGK